MRDNTIVTYPIKRLVNHLLRNAMIRQVHEAVSLEALVKLCRGAATCIFIALEICKVDNGQLNWVVDGLGHSSIRLVVGGGLVWSVHSHRERSRRIVFRLIVFPVGQLGMN